MLIDGKNKRKKVETYILITLKNYDYWKRTWHSSEIENLPVVLFPNIVIFIF